MNSKNIFAGIIASTVMSVASASILTSDDALVAEKKSEAASISNIFGNVAQTINNPECTVKPINATTKSA